MHKIKKKKQTEEQKPLMYDTVMSMGQSRAFFRIPACPCCTVQKKYGSFLARGPVFTETCPHCGTQYTCRPGLRSWLFALIVLLVCVPVCRVVMNAAEDMVPVFLTALLPVIGAWFLWPLTLSVRKKNENKKQK